MNDASTVDDWQALIGALASVAPDIAATWPELRDADTILSGAADRRENISEVWSWIGGHRLAVPEAARLFEDVQIEVEPIYTEQTGDEVNAVLRTTSLYARIPADRRQAFEDENLASPSGSAVSCGRASLPFS